MSKLAHSHQPTMDLIESRKDKLDAAARFEANPPKPAPITDATELFHALGKVYEYDGGFEDMPRCSVKALADLLDDDDPNEDIQFRAMYRLASTTVDALGKALLFARMRLDTGNDIDRAHARGIDKLLREAGVVLP